MIGKSLLFAAAACVAGGLASPVQAASVIDAVNSILTSKDPGPTIEKQIPIVFEDDDFSFLVKGAGNTAPFLQVGDTISGILKIPAVTLGDPLNTKDVTQIGKTSPTIPLGNATYPELTAVYELYVAGKTTVSGVDIYSLSAPATYSYSMAGLGFSSGEVFAIFEDAANDFSTGGVDIAADVTTARNGTLWATAGFSGTGTQFYHIADVPDTNNATEEIEFSLNFIKLPPLPPSYSNAEITTNIFVTTLYGYGTLDDLNPGGSLAQKGYIRDSDADFIVMYAPVPAAAWMGISLLGVLGGISTVRKMRRA